MAQHIQASLNSDRRPLSGQLRVEKVKELFCDDIIIKQSVEEVESLRIDLKIPVAGKQLRARQSRIRDKTKLYVYGVNVRVNVELKLYVYGATVWINVEM